MEKVVQNPIADAVIKQCPDLSDQFDNDFNDTNRLSGEEILRILCEQQCEEQIKSGMLSVWNFYPKTYCTYMLNRPDVLYLQFPL